MSATTLIGPDGREYDFDSAAPGADLGAALKAGYRQAGADGPTLGEAAMGVVHDVGEAAGAAALGVGQGLTAGLYGATRGNAEAKELKAQQDESPIAYTVGELGGMLTSPLNEVGALVTKGVGATSVAGRIAAESLGGAATGGLFGAGNALSEATLEDVPLTAEKLVAGAGLGALLGGVGGGIGGAIDEAAGVLLPKAGKLIGGAQKALDGVADDAAIASTRAQNRVLNRIGDEQMSAAASALRDRGHLAGSPDDILASVIKDRESVGAVLGKHLDDVEASGARPIYSDLGKRLDDFEASLNPIQRKAIAADVADARASLMELGGRPVGTTGKQGSSFRALDDVKQSIQKKGKFSRGPAGIDDETLMLKRRLAGEFRDGLDEQLLRNMAPEVGEAFLGTKKVYGALRDAERLAESGTERAGGIGIRDMMAAVVGGNLHPMGIAAALGSKMLRENGPAIFARVADAVAKSPALSTVAKSFAARLPELAPRMGPYGGALLQEAKYGAERALAAHMAYAQLDPSYAATAQLAGLTPEAPDEHATALNRAVGLTAIQEMTRAQDADIKARVDKAFRGTGKPSASGALKSQDFGAKRMRRDSPTSYRQRAEEVRQLASNPEALLERVTANMGNLGNVAPSVSAAMMAQAQRAVQYLAQAAAEPPKAGPLAAEWDAPEADRFAFAEKLEVVQQPLSVLDSAAAGTLTEEQMEALRAVYPGLAQQVADAALERLVESPKGVPYQARLMVSLLAGVDPDGTLSPEAIASNQTAIQASARREPAGQGAPGSPQDAGNVSVAQRTATPQQRRELRSE